MREGSAASFKQGLKMYLFLREDRKPAIILDYNHNKGSVDTLDKVVDWTSHWPLVIFYNFIDAKPL